MEEFTSLMQGQIGGRDMEQEIIDTFSVFRAEKIDDKLLNLMVQVLACDGLVYLCVSMPSACSLDL